MTVSDSAGDRLARAMKRAGIKNQELAAALGVDAGTVSRWRRDVQAPEDDKVEQVIALLREKGVLVSAAWLRYGKGDEYAARNQKELFPGAPEVEFDSPTAAQKGRIWLEQFILELVEDGADREFTTWARRFLMSPENYALYLGGSRDEMNDEQKLRHMQGLAVGVRAILKDRLKKGGRNEKARGNQD